MFTVIESMKYDLPTKTIIQRLPSTTLVPSSNTCAKYQPLLRLLGFLIAVIWKLFIQDCVSTVVVSYY